MNWGNAGPEDVWPSAEDEYLASLEPEVDYTPELILAISNLTEKQRFVIECRFGFRGDPMTVCEIAALMGISHQCVVRLQQRGLKRLRKGVQKSPISSDSYSPSVNDVRA